MRTAETRRAALQRGAEAEAFVAQELEGDGWTVVARNWRGAGGELDVVVCRGTVLRFVEVKARSEGGDPLDGMTATKQRRLNRAAEAFLSRALVDYDDIAFLVALVWATGEGWAVEWLDDAFDGE
ncbi:MAG: YraN family protein [Proteobacteria bacterium]|nr:YraN family protein [Pseudomonadota bacterium]